jgi:phage I-like protein
MSSEEPKRVIGRPFQPGQSGNPNGRPKSKPFKEALQRALNAAGDDRDMLEAVATALVGKAMMGDVPAIKELADRMDGKVTQPIEGDADGEPIVIRWQKS